MISIDAKIDHLGLFSNKNPDTSKALFKLGFRAAGGCDHLIPDKEGKLPANAHFVLDNGYMECVLEKPTGYREYEITEGGLIYFEFACKDIEEAYKNSEEKGLQSSDIVHAGRYADHGENKGEARFDCILLEKEIIENVLIGAVEHKTRGLFYKNKRYEHENYASRIEEVVLFSESSDYSDKVKKGIEDFQEGLGDYEKEEGIRKLTFMSSEECKERFCLDTEKGKLNKAGLILKTEDMNKCLECVKASGYPFKEVNGSIVVDLLDELNIFMVFEK